MFDWAKAVESLGGAIKSASECFAISKKRQSETEILKEKKRLKKAVDIAENIIQLIYKYLPLMTEEDIEDFKKYVEKFKKYN